MQTFAVYGMILLGNLLMAYNIYGFIRYARYIKGLTFSGKKNVTLIVPIVLLVLFQIGYILVGLFGSPDLVIAGILFGGSIFVFVMYKLLFDITQRIIESERRTAELTVAERSNRAKAHFLASMSHEIRTPINIIVGLVTIALKKPELDPVAVDPLQKILDSGNYLLNLVNNMIAVNSLEAGTLEMKHEDFSLGDMVRQLNSMIETLCIQKGLTYNFDMDESLPLVYSGDGMTLSEAVLPILDNAVKYTDPPGTVTFTVSGEKTDENTAQVSFTVTDTGVGIDSEFLSQIFDLFSREDPSSTTRFGGTGIGLASAKQKIYLLGGQINVSSEKGVGSKFTLTVPLALSQNQAPAKAEQEVSDEEVSLEGRHILIVEDIDENAEILADLLELEAAETDRAENGKVAVELFTESQPYYFDAILMDIRMPVMDGLEASRRIRALDRPDAKKVPILAYTANTSEEDRRNSYNAGIYEHIGKPSDSDYLFSKLKKCIAQYRKEGECAK